MAKLAGFDFACQLGPQKNKVEIQKKNSFPAFGFQIGIFFPETCFHTIGISS